jgi:acyl carrier protein
MTEVIHRIEKIFKKLFDISNLSDFNRQDYSEWDSLKHIELILELEDEFFIELNDSQGTEIKDFDSCVKVILEVL